MAETVLAECSDEELLEEIGILGNQTWCPKLEKIEALYERTKHGPIEFQWKCPGRRNPNEERKVPVEYEKPVVEPVNVSGAYDFDFDDEISPVVPAKLSSKMSTPKGTNKKRTTMAGIVANMEKHKLMDKMDDATSSKSANH